jgi:hypothetical protein
MSKGGIASLNPFKIGRIHSGSYWPPYLVRAKHEKQTRQITKRIRSANIE